MYLKNAPVCKKGGQSASVQSFLCEHRWAVIVICLPLSAHRSGGQLTADTLSFAIAMNELLRVSALQDTAVS